MDAKGGEAVTAGIPPVTLSLVITVCLTQSTRS